MTERHLAPASVSTRPVAEVLRARRARSAGTPFEDGARVALVVEGGAMRGVISAGMVSALEELGYLRTFDAVYGSSAGAINAAYFVAGQARLGTSIYYEDINNRRFIDLRRALRGRPIVDLGFLLDDVARRRKVLDVSRVLASPIPLTVMATDVDRRRACALGPFADAESLWCSLRASSTMPVVAGAPYTHGGCRYLDASLSEPVPVTTAERDGHTHVLVLLTRVAGVRPDVSAFDRYFVVPRLRRISPGLAADYVARSLPYAEVMAAIEAGTGPAGTARVLGVRVDGLRISKLERRRPVLESGAALGAAAVRALLG